MRRTATLLALVLAATACSNIGLGESHCSLLQGNNISSANVLNVQAVPTAKYTPCINELRLGWDDVSRFAEEDRAGISISRSISPFLTATVTESCHIPDDAVVTPSGYRDIRRFEDIESQAAAIEIALVPSGQRPLANARLLVVSLDGGEVDNRPVTYTIDEDIDRSVSSRVDSALLDGKYVWILDEIDAQEGTVQLRSNISAANGAGLSVDAALELIEEVVPDTFYRGDWYFIFEGGCITYEFDTKGTLAETVAADAEEALGFYPASQLREFAKEQGFDLE